VRLNSLVELLAREAVVRHDASVGQPKWKNREVKAIRDERQSGQVGAGLCFSQGDRWGQASAPGQRRGQRLSWTRGQDKWGRQVGSTSGVRQVGSDKCGHGQTVGSRQWGQVGRQVGSGLCSPGQRRGQRLSGTSGVGQVGSDKWGRQVGSRHVGSGLCFSTDKWGRMGSKTNGVRPLPLFDGSGVRPAVSRRSNRDSTRCIETAHYLLGMETSSVDLVEFLRDLLTPRDPRRHVKTAET
jgi:hypothetical protein